VTEYAINGHSGKKGGRIAILNPLESAIITKMDAKQFDQECWLETTRLTLQPTLVADAPALFQLLKDPTMYTFTGADPPVRVEELRQRITRWESRKSADGAETWLNWTVRLKADDSVIGHMQTSLRAENAELAWVVGIPFQGQGYAKEAVQAIASFLRSNLSVRKFTASIHPQHAASQAVARSIGLAATRSVTSEGEQVWTN
jgi:RimJ/RimL family protein N-acetyltransferase